ncbi:MAG: hypothetical protein MUF20_00310 [Methylotetracoccus sp.]|jgi:hypothetical protein|nr:hypothetical protein [Methylotetracoccus sp.]
MVKKATQTEEVVAEVVTEESKGLAKVISESAADACSAASNVLPEAGKLVRKVVYKGFYYATYGVVYSSMVVGSLIPSHSAVGEGLHDGAAAARKDFASRGETVTEAAATPSAAAA